MVDNRPEALFWKEYDLVCEYMAKHDNNMPDLISESCMRLINEDTDAFMDRVNCYAYARSMEKPMMPEEQRRFVDALQMAEDTGYFDK